MALALSGLFSRARRRHAAGWLLASLFFVILALGPRLILAGQNAQVGGHDIILPYHLLFKMVPFFDSMDFPYRFSLLVNFCLAMAAALGAAEIWKGKRMRPLLCMAAAGIVWLESALFSGAPVPSPRITFTTSKQLSVMAGEPGEFAVFDLPVTFNMDALNRYVGNLLQHGRPILYSNWPDGPLPFPSSLAQSSIVTNLLSLAGDMSYEPDEGLLFEEDFPAQMKLQKEAGALLSCLPGGSCDPALTARLNSDLADLAAKGITRFVVHVDLLKPDSRLIEVCDALFGPAAAREGRIMIYVTPQPGGSSNKLRGRPSPAATP